MTNGGAAVVAGGGGAAAAAAIAEAIKASGAIVRVEPNDFMTILQRLDNPLIVHTTGGFFSTNYQYLTSYKGLVFYTKSPIPLTLSTRVEIVKAKKIWIPS
jgi:ABC-type transport system substrate-binding protein